MITDEASAVIANALKVSVSPPTKVGGLLKAEQLRKARMLAPVHRLLNATARTEAHMASPIQEVAPWKAQQRALASGGVTRAQRVMPKAIEPSQEELEAAGLELKRETELRHRRGRLWGAGSVGLNPIHNLLHSFLHAILQTHPAS